MLIVILGYIVRIALIVLTMKVRVITTISHERNLIWAQKESGRNGVARLVGVNGNPTDWVVNRTATTRYITAPNNNWIFMALTFDYKEQTIYWSDAGNKKIQGLRLDGSNAAFVAHHGTSGHVYGLALDWLSGTLYWSDARYNWILGINRRDNTSSPVVIVDSGLVEPRGVAVHPGKGYLFWCDAGPTPKLERSDTTGASRIALVTEELSSPSGLAIDYTDDILYWSDNGKISSVDLDGQRRWTHFSLDNTRFFAISLYQNFLFATDQQENQLYVFDRDHSHHEVNFRLNAKPWGVLMYDEGRQGHPGAGGCQSAECEQVCASSSIGDCEQECASSSGGNCEQVCATDGDYTCMCGRGFVLADDGKTCDDDGRFGTPRFIYSISNAICQFPGNLADMSLTNVSLDTQCFLKHRRAAHALAADVASDVIFVAENNTKTITRIKLTGNEDPVVIVGGTGSVEGLAFDWLSKNIYWTDSVYQHVMVATSDGGFQKQIVHDSLQHPRSVVIDPVTRNLYWSDVGPIPKIERANLDGSNRTVIVRDNIGSPNHLAIDLQGEKLCWTDSVFDQIECAGFDGENRKSIVSLPRTDMYGVALFQDYVVWTDQNRRNGIHVGSRLSGEKIRGVIHPAVGKATDVITFDVSAQPTADSPCSIDNGGCSHLCFAVPNDDIPKCVCASGYDSSSGGDTASCETESFWDDLLLVTDTYRKQVYHVTLSTGQVRPLRGVKAENPIAVDYDPETRRVIWSDVSLAAIQSITVNGSGERVVRSLPKGSVPDGIAVDAISRLMFYTDAGRKLIAVMSVDGVLHKVLITEGLDQPRAIVADPLRGHIYWTDWGERSRISKASMDGSSQRHLVDTGEGGWPNGLTIDELGGRLFWCDAHADRIESCDLNGHGRRVIYREPDSHFFGIAFLGGIIFYTDWTKKTIMKLQHTGSRMTSSVYGPPLFARLNDIHIYRSSHNIYGLKANECSVNNGHCTQLCLPVNFTRVCACSDDENEATKSPSCTEPYVPTTPSPGSSSPASTSHQDTTTSDATTTSDVPTIDVKDTVDNTADTGLADIVGTTPTNTPPSSSLPADDDDVAYQIPLKTDTPSSQENVTTSSSPVSSRSSKQTTVVKGHIFSTGLEEVEQRASSTESMILQEPRATLVSPTSTSASSSTSSTSSSSLSSYTLSSSPPSTKATASNEEDLPLVPPEDIDYHGDFTSKYLDITGIPVASLRTAHVTEIHHHRQVPVSKPPTTLPVSDFVHGLSHDSPHLDRTPLFTERFENDPDGHDVLQTDVRDNRDYNTENPVGDNLAESNTILPTANIINVPTTFDPPTISGYTKTTHPDPESDRTHFIDWTVDLSSVLEWTTLEMSTNATESDSSSDYPTAVVDSTRRTPVDDFRASVSALLAILIAGAVLMCIIVIGGVVLYRKLDPNRRARRCGRQAEPALTSLSDMYELPSSKTNNPLACRYASMHDIFYNGSAEDGLDNLSYTPRDVNTYEEIVEESSRVQTLSTFK